MSSSSYDLRRRRTLIGGTVLALLAACASGPDIARLDAIRALEATREGCLALCTATDDPDRDVRRAACQALGQLTDPAAQAALAKATTDPELGVARAAVFSLGELDGAPPCAELVTALAHPDAGMRVLAARALGRRRQADSTDALLACMQGDTAMVVRAAAATALATLGSARSGARALDDSTRTRIAIAVAAKLDAEAEAVVRVALAYALAELQDPAADAAAHRALAQPLDSHATADARWTRVFALRALAANGGLSAGEVTAATHAADAQLQLAALAAVMTHRPAAMTDDMVRTIGAELVTGTAPVHVRARALEVLGALGTELPADLWTRLAADPAPTVRRAALLARARLGPAQTIAAIDAWLRAPDVFDRVVAVHALGAVPRDLAATRLAAAFDDDAPAVRAAVVAALATQRDLPGLDELCAVAAKDRDIAVREELGNTLLALAPGRAAIAREAFADRPDASFAEARKTLLPAVIACDPGAADLDELLEHALTDPDVGVRLVAARTLRERGRPVPPVDSIDRAPFPRVGVEVPMEFLAARPRIELHTDKGVIVIALAPALAPVHCWSLCQLVASGKLDGRVFHRVVPDFVVQGGDPRDDGYGNVSWIGGMLRREINPLPFLAGTLGMPRTAEPDTGGGQLFVTLGPTPWLDGSYTAFGRITSGLDVAERIEVGDRIVTASVANR